MLVETEDLLFKVVNIKNSNLKSQEDILESLSYKKFKKNQNLIFNFENVKFIHSSVLPVFIKYKHFAEKLNISIVLVINDKNLAGLFEASGISGVFQVCDTLTEAMEELDLVANY